MTKKELKIIRGKLLMRDVTFASIGRKFKVSREFVRKAVRGQYGSTTADSIRNYVEEILDED